MAKSKKSSVVSADDKKIIEDKLRRTTKLKVPKKPKLGKKPKANASLATIQKYIDTNKAKMERYQAEVDAYNKVKKEKTSAREELQREYLKMRY